MFRLHSFHVVSSRCSPHFPHDHSQKSNSRNFRLSPDYRRNLFGGSPASVFLRSPRCPNLSKSFPKTSTRDQMLRSPLLIEHAERSSMLSILLSHRAGAFSRWLTQRLNMIVSCTPPVFLEFLRCSSTLPLTCDHLEIPCSETKAYHCWQL